MKSKDYIYYTLEDFLTDDFFIASVKAPSTESIAFWEGFLNSNPPNISEYYAARRYLESYHAVMPLITDEEISLLWDNISAEAGIGRRKKRRFLRPLVCAGAAAAAILVMLVIWPPAWLSRQSGIYEFAASAPDITEEQDTRLILSDDRTVVINEKMAEITYGEAEIKVSEDNIPKEESAKYNQLIVPGGKMSRLTLADGTKVWVNANTRVVYPVEFTGKQREIYVDGEIFLDVVHDKRPFVVRTQDMTVEVLGTRFNVSSYEMKDMRSVVLVEGSVRVVENNKKGKFVIEPDQMYEMSGGRSQVTDVDVQKYISWKDGLYMFDKEKLGNVITRLSDYYGVTIVCSEEAGKFRCSGKLDLKENLEEVLTGLTRTMPVSYEKVDDNIYLIVHK